MQTAIVVLAIVPRGSIYNSYPINHTDLLLIQSSSSFLCVLVDNDHICYHVFHDAMSDAAFIA